MSYLKKGYNTGELFGTTKYKSNKNPGIKYINSLSKLMAINCLSTISEHLEIKGQRYIHSCGKSRIMAEKTNLLPSIIKICYN